MPKKLGMTVLASLLIGISTGAWAQAGFNYPSVTPMGPPDNLPGAGGGSPYMYNPEPTDMPQVSKGLGWPYEHGSRPPSYNSGRSFIQGYCNGRGAFGVPLCSHPAEQ